MGVFQGNKVDIVRLQIHSVLCEMPWLPQYDLVNVVLAGCLQDVAHAPVSPVLWVLIPVPSHSLHCGINLQFTGYPDNILTLLPLNVAIPVSGYSRASPEV